MHSANYAKKVEDLFRGLAGLGLPNHSLTGRRRLRKWNHIKKVKCTFYPVNWTWKLIELEKKDPLSASFKMFGAAKLQNRKAIKALIRCTHFLAHQHIAHTTNLDKLVELVVSCGGETFQTFLDRAGGNATYTSKMAVVEFVNAFGTWVEESLLKRLHKAPFF